MVPVKMVLASRPGWKMTPGERTSWLTTTRSVPLTMKVPRSVIIGKSPMKTVCSLISPGGGVQEPRPDEDRGGVGHVLLLALLHRELRRRAQVGVGRVELQLQAELAGEVLDRADVVEGLGQPLVEEPLERVALDRRSGPAGAAPRRCWRRTRVRGYGTVRATAYSSQLGSGRVSGTAGTAATTGRRRARRGSRERAVARAIQLVTQANARRGVHGNPAAYPETGVDTTPRIARGTRPGRTTPARGLATG